MIPSFVAPQVGPGGTTLVFRLVVSDGMASSDPDEVSILVQNVNDPPDCTQARAFPSLLWPPNHKLVPVEILGISDPNADPVTITVTGIRQDEPISGSGDGDTAPDAAVSGGSILLRAERAGNGDGRVYTIYFTATDSQGGQCQGLVKVSVPRSRPQPAQDGGGLFDSR
jgi:hypothetical protein